MNDIIFRAWHYNDQKMYYRAYQKLGYVLLCDDDGGREEGKGVPVKKVPYEDCEMLQFTTLRDRWGKEIFEGDCLKIFYSGGCVEDCVDEVPDMFRSRNLHPLQPVLDRSHIDSEDMKLAFEVTGNLFEKKSSSHL